MVDSLTQLSEIDYKLEAMQNLLCIDTQCESDQVITRVIRGQVPFQFISGYMGTGLSLKAPRKKMHLEMSSVEVVCCK